MTMRDRYFRAYQTVVYKRGFYKAHYVEAYWLNLTYSIVLIVASIAFATIWSISKTQPVIWALLIAVAQLLQAFSTLLPWSAQLGGLKYLMPELEKLIIEMAAEWGNLDLKEYNNIEIQELINKFDMRFCELENRYVGTLCFSEAKRFTNKASRTQAAYFNLRYNKEN